MQIFNRKLRKIMKNKDNVRILNHETIREDFIQHGFHLNATGEIKVVKLMSKKISQLFEAKKKHPIILKWRTTHNDPSLVNSIPQVKIMWSMITKEETKIKWILITKERGLTQEVMIFYGYKA